MSTMHMRDVPGPPHPAYSFSPEVQEFLLRRFWGGKNDGRPRILKTENGDYQYLRGVRDALMPMPDRAAVHSLISQLGDLMQKLDESTYGVELWLDD